MTDYEVEDAEFERVLRERYPNLRPVEKAPDNRTKAARPKSRESFRQWLTPIEEFYVLNHYPTPEIAPDEWRVSITGQVDEPVELSVEEIVEEYPTVTIPHTMECAGNGRAAFDDVDGEPRRYVQWRDSAVGNAQWTGTPLRAVLSDCGGDTSDGTWLAAIGGDAPDGEDVFARSLPMSKVVSDCILAYRMNGDPLPPEHGYPVRVIVPGWYGVNSVKWVTELRVMDRMMAGPEWEAYTEWQQRSYRLVGAGDDPREHESIAEFDTWEQTASGEISEPYLYDQNVMSLISHPVDGATVVPGSDGQIEVLGVAWAGDDRVESVAVSADSAELSSACSQASPGDCGKTWQQGEFSACEIEPNAWRFFRCQLSLPPGRHRLVSRATDEHGRSQPSKTGTPEAGLADDAYPWNSGGYGNNAYSHYGVDVIVESPDER